MLHLLSRPCRLQPRFTPTLPNTSNQRLPSKLCAPELSLICSGGNCLPQDKVRIKTRAPLQCRTCRLQRRSNITCQTSCPPTRQQLVNGAKTSYPNFRPSCHCAPWRARIRCTGGSRPELQAFSPRALPEPSPGGTPGHSTRMAQT